MKEINPGKCVKVIDLFCGIGGLTHGFEKEGINVVAGIDSEEACRYGYEANNQAKFIAEDIRNVSAKDLNELYGARTDIKILMGCAPCQPFSTMNNRREAWVEDAENWGALGKFAKLIEELKPDIVSMENVKELSKGDKYPVFKRFISTLKLNGYGDPYYKVVDTSEYGIPQKRKRLVLLASRLGEIELIKPTHGPGTFVTVRDTIASLPPIEDGETDPNDKLHTASKLSPLNKKRILATPHDGGSATAWDESLRPDCYKKKSGHTYLCSVYGRMKWDEPSPTMTTHCVSLGTGRYGHPEQDRAITLREAARFQTFPEDYVFMDAKNFSKTKIARFIGNAVPVALGRVIAKSIKLHLMKYAPESMSAAIEPEHDSLHASA